MTIRIPTSLRPLHEHTVTPIVCGSGRYLLLETFLARDGAHWRVCEAHFQEGVGSGYLLGRDQTYTTIDHKMYCEACPGGGFEDMWEHRQRRENPT
jgi:hypothetical protein